MPARSFSGGGRFVGRGPRAGGSVEGRAVGVAGVSAADCAGLTGQEIRCSNWSMRSRMSWKAGLFRWARARARTLRCADLVDGAEDVEASESWSDEEPSEADDAEGAFLRAGAVESRLVVGGRRAVRGGAVGTAKVVLRCEGGSAAAAVGAAA